MEWLDIEEMYEMKLAAIDRIGRNADEKRGMYRMLRGIVADLRFDAEDKCPYQIKDNIFHYRNKDWLVEDDDAGQQLVLMLPDGKEYGGGAFNSHPEAYFITLIDNYLDNKF